MRNVVNLKKKLISNFYFTSYGHFCTPIFDEFFTITRKIKNGKLIFHSIQHIAQQKWDQNWGEEEEEGGGRVCISLVGKKPPIHLLPSPMHATGFSFCFFPGFLTISIFVIEQQHLAHCGSHLADIILEMEVSWWVLMGSTAIIVFRSFRSWSIFQVLASQTLYFCWSKGFSWTCSSLMKIKDAPKCKSFRSKYCIHFSSRSLL